MKPTKLLHETQETFNLLVQSRNAFISALVIIPVFVLLDIEMWASYYSAYNKIVTLADAFLLVSHPTYYAISIVILSVYITFQLVKHDFSLPAIVRQKNKGNIWLKQSYKILLSSVCLSIYSTACTYGIGLLTTSQQSNWNEYGSIFYSSTKALAQVPMWKIVTLFFAMSVLEMTVMNLLALLVYWLTDNPVLGIVTVLLWGVLETYTGLLPFFYTQTSILYDKWIPPAQFWGQFLCPLIWIAVLTLAGLIVAKRKDFLSVHQKTQ